MKAAILTYHAMRVLGDNPEDNDLLGLASDLSYLASAGIEVVSLREIVEGIRSPQSSRSRSLVVGLSCDDGSDFDYEDLIHPTWGKQRGVLGLLMDHNARCPHHPAHITSFVIVSPEARMELDRTCMIGAGWWTDGWWRDAASSGVMDIANHSWDHNHDSLPVSFLHGVPSGTFTPIASEKLADLEIAKAAEHLRTVVPNPGDALFAYPYGEANDYLAGAYFPAKGQRLGLRGAFTTDPSFVTASTDPWLIPRFVRGRDWSSELSLAALLARA